MPLLYLYERMLEISVSTLVFLFFLPFHPAFLTIPFFFNLKKNKNNFFLLYIPKLISTTAMYTDILSLGVN